MDLSLATPQALRILPLVVASAAARGTELGRWKVAKLSCQMDDPHPSTESADGKDDPAQSPKITGQGEPREPANLVITSLPPIDTKRDTLDKIVVVVALVQIPLLALTVYWTGEAARAARDTVEEARLLRKGSDLVAKETLDEMKVQSRAMQEAAEATTESANAQRTIAQATRNTLELAQRAYVSTEGWKLENLDSKDASKKPQLRFHIRNRGNSPATMKVMNWGVAFRDLQEFPQYIATTPLNGIQITQGEVYNFPLYVDGILLVAIDASLKFRFDFWFFVKLTYEDPFGQYEYCSIVKRNLDTGELVVATVPNYHCNRKL